MDFTKLIVPKLFLGEAALTFLQVALGERIAVVAGHADAHRRVGHDSTLGIGSAGAWTRVDALVVPACSIVRALAVADALGSTVRRAADELRQTRARGRIVDYATLGVEAARRRLAGIHWPRGRRVY